MTAVTGTTGATGGATDEGPAADRAVIEGVGPRLRDLRNRAGWTLAELAERTGVGASTLSRLETGRVRPTLEQLLPLARAHRLPLDELVDAPRVGDPRLHLRPVERFGLTFIALTERAGGVQSYKVVYPPAVTLPQPRLQTHDGHEWVYVLAGVVLVVLHPTGGTRRELRLEAGEATELDTRTPHWIGNPRPEPAEVLAVFGTQGQRIHLHDPQDPTDDEA